MTTLKELVAQKEALEAQIALAIKSEKKEAVSKVKELIAEYSLTESDVFGGEKRAKLASKNPAVAKYRDPATGLTWSGRGRTPKWMEGKDRAQFEI